MSVNVSIYTSRPAYIPYFHLLFPLPASLILLLPGKLIVGFYFCSNWCIAFYRIEVSIEWIRVVPGNLFHVCVSSRCKRSLSTSGHVVDDFRSNLIPKAVEALICTQDWLRTSNVCIDLEQLLEDMENMRKKLVAIWKIHVEGISSCCF